MHKHPVQIIFVRTELITSGGVLKHTILNLLFGRNLSQRSLFKHDLSLKGKRINVLSGNICSDL